MLALAIFASVYDAEDLSSIREARDRWESERLAPALDRDGERRERFATVSDREVDRLYTPADVADRDYGEDIGFPGEPPYTRGVYPTMYRGRTWTMRQFAVDETPKFKPISISGYHIREDALDAVDDAIAADENVMPPIVDAVKAYATMGEIMALFEDHHGSYRERLGAV
jgi:methylmalonyl-CoA mutase N-terminal domain/subunit